MADEITITIKGQVINGNLRETWSPGTLKYNQGDAAAASNTVVAGVASTVLNLGAVSTRANWFFYRHLADTTDAIHMGSVVGTTVMTFARIHSGASGCFQMIPGTTYAVLSTASTPSMHWLVLST